MRVQPRFVGRIGPADVVTVANAALGFAAAAVATTAPVVAARLLLLAAIADGLDGVLARQFGGTDVGQVLDSLADVASFAVAPAVFVFAVARAEWGLTLDGIGAASLLIPGLFVAAAVLRLGLYTAEDVDGATTEGVQTTLAGTILAAGYLAGLGPLASALGTSVAAVLLGVTGLFVYLMLAPVTYPELYARDALVLGALQALAVLFPTALGGAFPRSLLLAALAYLLLAPRFYWRAT
ncbi:protein sorting system archaetidylserine synthase [Haloglomus litoreum]|uniref:protein sorting system archaetidylserine synthase n=1 Tax=Haloglomus litoreum TaxID=3034026 RepID=UPI0023E84A3E|nr:protein sorting system archaetidylserine synthase [Haloglomus sp. DT116]